MKFTFSLFYFVWFLILLSIELIIGLFINDNWIRPFLGDFLVVILLYAAIKSFFTVRVNPTLFWVLIFSYLIETLQYFHFVKIIGLQDIPIVCTLIGTTFSWFDIIMYTLGICFVAIIELIRRIHQTENGLKTY